MQDFIKSILIFVILGTILKELINNEKYKGYFRFFNGLVLILIVVSPLSSFILGSDKWYNTLEKELFEADIEDVSAQLNLADGSLEEVIKKGCREDIEEQIIKLASKRGLSVSSVYVELEGSEDISVKSVDIELADENNNGGAGNRGSKENSNTGSDEALISEINDIDIEVDVETISILSGDDSKKECDLSERKKADGSRVRNLKLDISNYLMVSRGVINIWE